MPHTLKLKLQKWKTWGKNFSRSHRVIQSSGKSRIK